MNEITSTKQNVPSQSPADPDGWLSTPGGQPPVTDEHPPASVDAAAALRGARIGRIFAIVQRQGLVVLLVALMIYLWHASPYFLTIDNLLSIGAIAGVLGVMAVAQTLLIVCGGLDISVGSIIAVASAGVVLMTNEGVNVWMAAAVMMVCSGLIGALNGVLVVVLGVNPLITTLGTMSIFSGVAYMMTTSAAFTDPQPSFGKLGNGSVATIPTPLIILIAAVVVTAIFERFTRTGRAIYAIGGNTQAARLAGLHVKRIPFFLYVLSGLSAGLAGLILTSQLGASSPDVGASYTLEVVTAVILGGASLAGGRGTVIGTVLAVLFLGVLSNGFTLLLVSSYAQTLILGIALIIAVLIDQTARRLAKSSST